MFFSNPCEGLTFLHEIFARSNFAPKTPPETPFDEVDTLEIDWVWGSLKLTFAGGSWKGKQNLSRKPLASGHALEVDWVWAGCKNYRRKPPFMKLIPLKLIENCPFTGYQLSTNDW